MSFLARMETKEQQKKGTIPSSTTVATVEKKAVEFQLVRRSRLTQGVIAHTKKEKPPAHDSNMSPSKYKIVNVNDLPINKMCTQQHHHHHHHHHSKLSSQDRQDVNNISRKLRRLKRQMLLKKIEASKNPSPVDNFRRLIIDLAVEQEALEARRSRSGSLSSSSRESSSFQDTKSSSPLDRSQE